MKSREAVAKRITDLCNERGITVNALANLAAVPPSTVKNIIYGVSKNPGIATIKMLCDGLDITLIEFFDNEIFLDLEQEIE
jgi:transcriptional regulator with XRE-family HTH domain